MSKKSVPIMAGLVKKLRSDWYISKSNFDFALTDNKRKQEYLDSRKTIFFQEMLATLKLAYETREYSGLRRLYPGIDDVIIADQNVRKKNYKEGEKKYGTAGLLKKIWRNLKGQEPIWFFYPLEGNFCRIYLADYVARNTPFVVRCAKICAACWLYCNERYYGRNNDGTRDARTLWNLPIERIYLVLINLGMGAWLKNNLETVVIKEKEELKKTLGKMHEISGDLSRLKEEIGTLDAKPNRRELCELLFAHMAHVNNYLISLLESQETVVGEKIEIAAEEVGKDKKAGVNVLNEIESRVEEHKKLLETLAKPLEIISHNLSNPEFAVSESIKEFKLSWNLRDLVLRIEGISKERQYEIHELKSVCLGFHGLVHSELGYLNTAIKKEQNLY